MALPDAVERVLTSVRARSNRLWITPAIGTVAAVLLALIAGQLGGVVPAGDLPDIDEATLESLLTVIASSMLAVTTFSLSIMVSALANAASSATPRATELVMSDPVTHTAIASFLSAFVYSVIARTALGMGVYGPAGRWVLLVGTVVVLIWLLVTLVRWVKTLSSLGLVSNTLDKVEAQASATLRRHRQQPGLGARLAAGSDDGAPLRSGETGYLTHLDVDRVRSWARKRGARVHLGVRPGTFVHPGSVLARVVPAGDDDRPSGGAQDTPAPDDDLRRLFRVEASRGYDQDPRYGLIALAEIAQRALSPAVNDPGTAIDALARMTRVLLSPAPDAEDPDPDDPVSLEPLDPAELMDAFGPVGRDAAAMVEVGVRLQKNLAALAANGAPPLAAAALAQSALALRRARAADVLAEDLRRLEEAAAEVGAAGRGRV